MLVKKTCIVPLYTKVAEEKTKIKSRNLSTTLLERLKQALFIQKANSEKGSFGLDWLFKSFAGKKTAPQQIHRAIASELLKVLARYDNEEILLYKPPSPLIKQYKNQGHYSKVKDSWAMLNALVHKLSNSYNELVDGRNDYSLETFIYNNFLSSEADKISTEHYHRRNSDALFGAYNTLTADGYPSKINGVSLREGITRLTSVGQHCTNNSNNFIQLTSDLYYLLNNSAHNIREHSLRDWQNKVRQAESISDILKILNLIDTQLFLDKMEQNQHYSHLPYASDIVNNQLELHAHSQLLIQPIQKEYDLQAYEF